MKKNVIYAYLYNEMLYARCNYKRRPRSHCDEEMDTGWINRGWMFCHIVHTIDQSFGCYVHCFPIKRTSIRRQYILYERCKSIQNDIKIRSTLFFCEHPSYP